MERIIPPIGPGSPAPAVANLQEAMLFIVDKRQLTPNNLSLAQWKQTLSGEMAAQAFGERTKRLLVGLLAALQLPSAEVVNEGVAEALNHLLDSLGAFSRLPQPNTNFPLSLGTRGPDVATLQANLRLVGNGISQTEIDEHLFGVGTQSAVRQFQSKYKLPVTGVFNEATQAALLRAVAAVDTDRPRVEGRIFFENGVPAGDITLRFVNRGFGEELPTLGETKTDAQGFYSIGYDSGGKAVNLEVHAVPAQGELIPLSRTKFNAGRREVLNLVAPTKLRPRVAEYRRLAAALARRIGNLDKLKEAQEEHEQDGDEGQPRAARRDLTLLHQSTGWDARLIGLAAITHKLAAEIGLSPEVVYAMARAGLPTHKQLLARVSTSVVEAALHRANNAGIVALSDQEIASAKAAFQMFARAARRADKVPGALSSFGDLLAKSGLNPPEQAIFEEVHFAHGGKGSEMWQKAREAGIPEQKISTLQLQGKLAFFTHNNADLASALAQEIGSPTNLFQLVEKDLYRANQWETRIRAIAGTDDALDKAIPTAYEGKTVEERLKTYTGDLARKVRLSYPTHVVTRMIGNGELRLGPAPVQTSVETFLRNAVGLGFELGRVPVETFVRNNSAQLFEANATEVEIQSTKHAVKKLQRLYQITPGNEALQVLLDNGFSSAQDIVKYTYPMFAEYYGEQFDKADKGVSRKVTDLVYRKAQQVTTTVYNFFRMYNEVKNPTPVPAVSSSPAEIQDVQNSLIEHFPTLETLFGSMDFCDCEHCQSVLSPAAYLVDLFKFIDQDDLVWKNVLTAWKTNHYGAPYPFKDPEEAAQAKTAWTQKYGNAPFPFRSLSDWNAFRTDWKQEHPGQPDPDPEMRLKPYDVLIDRRPDLPHLPLTCENTHTAMPYIDIVNEILEYYVAHTELTKDAVHDTGEATTPELLAEPQNIIPEAYDVLKQARYPLTLPLDLWLETVRRFFDYAEMPLWQVLEIFRPSNELFKESQAYDRAAIFNEYLGLSPAEQAMCTDPNPLPGWFKLYGYATEAEATTEKHDEQGQRIDLNSAKALSRRLGVTYKQLVELIQTWFVNPHLENLVFVRKLGVGLTDVLRHYKVDSHNPLTAEEEAAFQLRLADLAINTQMTLQDLQAKIDAAWSVVEVNEILFLRDPDTGCNFDKTTLQYANGESCDALAFLRITLFVRLWKKLGWTIEETNRALKAFLPQNLLPLTKANPTAASNLGPALQTALIYLAHLKALNEKVKVGKNSRQKLLTFWSPLPTTGKNPLYAQLFLGRSVLKNDSVFDDPLGNYLSAGSIERAAATREFTTTLENVAGEDKLEETTFEKGAITDVSYDPIRQIQQITYLGVLDDTTKAQLKTAHPSEVFATLLDKVQELNKDFLLIKGHLPAIQGALNLTADEIRRILTDGGKDLATAELSLNNVSLLYRYGLLAKAVRLPVADLITLKNLSGLDPFKQLEPAPITTIEEDYPFQQTLHFVDLAEQVKESGFKIEDLEYLLRHRFDPVGKYRPDPAALLAAVKNFAIEIRRIQREHAVPKDATTLTDDILRQKLALVFPSNIVELFLAMWNGTKEYQVVQKITNTGDKLDPETFAQEIAIRVGYHAVRQEQYFTYRGVLLESEKQALKTKYPTANVAELLDLVQAQAKNDFKEDFQKTSDSQGALGFLEETEFESLFTPISKEITEEQDRKKRQVLAEAFLPFLQKRLIRQFVVQTLASSLNADLLLIDALLTDLLNDPDKEEQPLLATFTLAATEGATAEFYVSPDLSNVESPTVGRVATTDLSDAPTGTNSVRFSGYLEVPTSGPYLFYVVLGKKDAAAEFRLSALPEPVIAVTAVKEDEEFSNLVELKAGALYDYTLEARNLQGGAFALQVMGETTPRENLSQLALYPKAVVERFRRGQVVLTKSLQLIQGFGFTQREVRHVLTHSADFSQVDLSKLPTLDPDPVALQPTELFKQFLRLADYARLKKELAPDSDDLTGIFEAANLQDTALDAEALEAERLFECLKRMAELTRRDQDTLSATIRALQLTASDFANEQGLWRLWNALQVLGKLGVPAVPVEAITRWATPNPNFNLARDLRNTIKARYEPEDWQRIAQPIFDKLRQRQRDALVAHIMHQHSFERVEELFEYFLIDPGMEPVVQTSRLRLAISSLQTFIQRCFLNLESNVVPHSSIINSTHWEWMKRYRVWEANRKIFLFPENWLEPEWRDDKTHLFQELESVLLQGDVSRDLVEEALYNYLKKLEALAYLDIVSMYCEDDQDPAPGTLHVIGRTHNNPPEYYYRRYAHQMWTPWEPVTTEIEGDHIVAVMWRERLHLFWVTFFKKPVQDSEAGGEVENADNLLSLAKAGVLATPQSTVDIQLNWSEYYQSQWSTRVLGSSGALTEIPVEPKFTPSDVFISISKSDDSGKNPTVKINLTGNNIDKAFLVVSKNSRPKASTPNEPIVPPYLFGSEDGHVTYYSPGAPPSSPPQFDSPDYDLYVQFIQPAIGPDGLPTAGTAWNYPILARSPYFSILPPSNSLADDTWEYISPFFYKNDAHTFFVEPTLSETTADVYDGYGVSAGGMGQTLDENLFTYMELVAAEPFTKPHGPEPDPIDESAQWRIQYQTDWLTDQGAALQFGNVLLGTTGGLNPVVSSARRGTPKRVITSGGMRSMSLQHTKRLSDSIGGKFIHP